MAVVSRAPTYTSPSYRNNFSHPKGSWLPSDLETSSIGAIRELAGKCGLEVGGDRARELKIMKIMIQDYPPNAVLVDGGQNALSSPRRFLVELKKRARWVPKPVKEIHLGAVGPSVDVFTIRMLFEESAQFLIGPRCFR